MLSPKIIIAHIFFAALTCNFFLGIAALTSNPWENSCCCWHYFLFQIQKLGTGPAGNLPNAQLDCNSEPIVSTVYILNCGILPSKVYV